MALSINTQTNDSDLDFHALLAFVEAMPEDERPDVSTDAGVEEAIAAFKAAQTGATETPKVKVPGEKREKTAKNYRVLILWSDGRWENVGTGLSHTGAPPKDPSKYSPRQKLEATAVQRVSMAQRLYKIQKVQAEKDGAEFTRPMPTAEILSTPISEE